MFILSNQTSYRMQSSSIPPRFQKRNCLQKAQLNTNKKTNLSKKGGKYGYRCESTIVFGSFQYFCMKLGIIHYATQEKYEKIDFLWKPIYQEMQSNNIDININSFNDIISYLNYKLQIIPLSKKFGYEYILREFTNYTRLSIEFVSNCKDYIRRLQIYAKTHRCTNMEELKRELTQYLHRYVVQVEYGDKDNKNDYEKQDWLIISRYICDYLEEGDEFGEQFTLFN